MLKFEACHYTSSALNGAHVLGSALIGRVFDAPQLQQLLNMMHSFGDVLIAVMVTTLLVNQLHPLSLTWRSRDIGGCSRHAWRRVGGHRYIRLRWSFYAIWICYIVILIFPCL